MVVGAVVVVVMIVLAWFFWPGRDAPRRSSDNPDLEEAEREVREAPDEESVRDWGPGTGQKPLP